MFDAIAAEALKSPLPANAVILDVRTEPEWVEARLAQAHILVVLDQLTAKGLQEQGIALDQPILILCKAGVRARTAAQILSAGGFTDLSVIEGGLIACYNAGIDLTAG